jgi:hypothetical protein
MKRSGLIATTLTAALLGGADAHGLVVGGRTSFVAVPTRAELINFCDTAFCSGAEYFLVMPLPQGADAGLGGISLQQIRGVSPAFHLGPVQPTAFLGRPRHQGSEIAVSADFSEDYREVSIHFEEPVPPGETITVAFRVNINPPADFYVFSVAASPWGPAPISQPVGVVSMSVFSPVP